MLLAKKILKISLLFILFLSTKNQNCLGKTNVEKNNASKGNNTNVTGKLNVAGSTTFNDTAYAKNGLQISNGDLTVSNPSGAKKYFNVNTNKLNYSGDNAGFGNYSFDLKKNQLLNKPYYSGQSNITTKRTLKGFTRSTNLQIFPISFSALLNDATSTALHGAHFNIKAIIGGTIESSPVEVFYVGNVYILPANASENPSTLTVINQTTTTLVGDSITFNAAITGNGTSATLYLVSSTDIADTEISYYYEVVSNNINSIG